MKHVYHFAFGNSGHQVGVVFESAEPLEHIRVGEEVAFNNEVGQGMAPEEVVYRIEKVRMTPVLAEAPFEKRVLTEVHVVVTCRRV